MINCYITKFKTCKPFNPNDLIKFHTPRFPAAYTGTIQPNLLCKSIVKFL